VRKIDTIVVHCSATPAGLDIGAREIRRMHMDPKRPGGPFSDIGYHFVIRLDGEFEAGRVLEVPGAHVGGHNARSIGICLVGGLDLHRKPANTFTDEQFDSLADLIDTLLARFPGARVLGHRDLSPDKDGDGRVERHEWVKECPCFDVAEWLASRGLAQTTN
jgi:N-acetylmuramoyl-L-alanine amidase